MQSIFTAGILNSNGFFALILIVFGAFLFANYLQRKCSRKVAIVGLICIVVGFGFTILYASQIKGLLLA